MKNKLKYYFYNANIKFLLRDILLMESNPDFEDNTKAVYDELIKRGVNKKIKIVWFCYGDKHFDVPKNVKCIYPEKNKVDRIKKKFYNYFAKYIIDCNRFIYKKNKKQFRLHLTHGASLKYVPDYCAGVGSVDYILSLSKYFQGNVSELFNMPEGRVLSLGFPRNDGLLRKNNNADDFYKKYCHNKIIVWLPTYRSHRANKGGKNKRLFKFGVPNIHSEEELREVDYILSNNNIKLLIKLHPAEDLSALKDIKLENIEIMTAVKLSSQNMNVYSLLSHADALITDYSSIYYDYLLLNRPVCLAIEDIKEYQEKVGLVYDNYEDNIAGEYAYDFNGLKTFIKHIADNNDVAKKTREKAMRRFHDYIDDKSSVRVVDFFLDKSGIKYGKRN